MTAPAAIVRLRALRGALRGGAGLDLDDAEWLARGISAFLSGEAASLDMAFGLQPGAGERTWRTREAVERRNRILMYAARDFFGDQPNPAGALAAALCRYATTSWLRDRTFDRCPDRYQDVPQGYFWHALKAHPHPPGERMLRAILTAMS